MDIASASFLLRILKPYQPDNWYSLNAPLDDNFMAWADTELDNLKYFRLTMSIAGPLGMQASAASCHPQAGVKCTY